jgi:ankyrin repeat protein
MGQGMSIGDLHSAVRTDSLEDIDGCAGDMEVINGQDEQGETAVHIAARLARPKVIIKLHGMGANINIQSNNGSTAVHKAVCEGNLICIEELHNCGANLNVKNHNGLAPLHLACIFNYRSVIALLVGLGADTNILNDNGDTPAICAIRAGNNCIFELRHNQSNTNLLLLNHQGWSAAHVACETDNYKALDSLDEYKSQANTGLRHIDRANSNGWTPAHSSAFYGTLMSMSVLIKLGANMNTMNKQGHTPLHMAVLFEHSSIAPLMTGCDPSVRSGYPVTSANQSPDPVYLGVDTSPGLTAMHLAIYMDRYDEEKDEKYYFEAVRELLSHGFDLNLTNSSGMNTLNYTLELWKDLPESKRDPHGIYKLLLTNGADVNQKCNRGLSPLSRVTSSAHESPQQIEALLKHGADAKSTDISGQTMLQMAEANGHDLAKSIIRRYTQAAPTFHEPDAHGKVARKVFKVPEPRFQSALDRDDVKLRQMRDLLQSTRKSIGEVIESAQDSSVDAETRIANAVRDLQTLLGPQ